MRKPEKRTNAKIQKQRQKSCRGLKLWTCAMWRNHTKIRYATKNNKNLPLKLLKSILKLVCVDIFSENNKWNPKRALVIAFCYFWIAFEMLNVSSDFRFFFWDSYFFFFLLLVSIAFGIAIRSQFDWFGMRFSAWFQMRIIQSFGLMVAFNSFFFSISSIFA